MIRRAHADAEPWLPEAGQTAALEPARALASEAGGLTRNV